MKTKSILMAMVLATGILFSACSPKTTNSGAMALKRGNVSGNWVLSNITYEGIPEAAILTLFNEAAPKCFVNSTWSFTNSGNGSYNLVGGADCTARSQNIFWSVSTGDETFQFKKINEGEKAKNVTDGYRLVLAAATGDMLTLKSPIEVGSGVAYAVLNFTKQ